MLLKSPFPKGSNGMTKYNTDDIGVESSLLIVADLNADKHHVS